MSKPIRAGRLRAIADEMNEPIETLIPRMVDEAGSISAAAAQLGVNRNAVLYWMKKLGYSPRPSSAIVWVKE